MYLCVCIECVPCMYLFMHACMHACVYACMCACMHVGMHACTYAHFAHTHTSTDELIDMQLRIRRTGPAFMPHRTGAFSLKHTNYPEEDTCGRLYTHRTPTSHILKNHDTHSRTPRTATHPALRRRTFLTVPPSSSNCRYSSMSGRQVFAPLSLIN